MLFRFLKLCSSSARTLKGLEQLIQAEEQAKVWATGASGERFLSPPSGDAPRWKSHQTLIWCYWQSFFFPRRMKCMQKIWTSTSAEPCKSQTWSQTWSQRLLWCVRSDMENLGLLQMEFQLSPVRLTSVSHSQSEIHPSSRPASQIKTTSNDSPQKYL